MMVENAQSPLSSVSLPALPVESAIAKKQQAAAEDEASGSNNNNILFIALGTVIIFTSLLLLALLVLLIKKKKRELQRSTQLCLPSWSPTNCNGGGCANLNNVHTIFNPHPSTPSPAQNPKRRRHHSSDRSKASGAAKGGSGRRRPNAFQEYKYKEIQTATDDFSTIIGRGGYGTVYRARFSDGTIAAVKRMNTGNSKHGSHRLLQEFSKEMELLSRLHHRHLVTLKGFCTRRRDRFLVYEYMENGSLREHLQGSDISKSPLSWQTRMQIAIDVASALEYLHCYCDPPLCHRDIKSSNILLDRDFTAKIADFGLAHATPAAATDKSSEMPPMATTDVRGTPGYMDPEYVVTRKLTAKSDVYSYGVLLLELVSGRAAVQEKVNIVEWAEQKYNANGGDVRAMADPCLKSTSSYSSNKNYASEMRSVVRLARMCTNKESEKRPSIRQVMRILQEIESSRLPELLLPLLHDGPAGGGLSSTPADLDHRDRHHHLLHLISADSPSYLNLSDEIGSLSSSPSPYYHHRHAHHNSASAADDRHDFCVSFRFETTPPLSPDIIEQQK